MCEPKNELSELLQNIIKQLSDITTLAEYSDAEHYVCLGTKDGVFFIMRDGASLLTTKDGQEAVATFYSQIGSIYQDNKDNVSAEFSTLREVLLSRNDFIRGKLDALGSGDLSKSMQLLDFDLVTKNYIKKQLEYFGEIIEEMDDCERCNAQLYAPGNGIFEQEGFKEGYYKPNLSGNFTYSEDQLNQDGSLILKAEDIQLSTKAVIFDSKQRVLLMKDSDGVWWDLPGGHVQDGESIEEGLYREVQEEAGLTVTSSKQLFVESLELGDPPINRPVVFFIASAYGEVQLSEEHSMFVWAEESHLDMYSGLGVFLPIIKKIYSIAEKGNLNDVIKFAPADLGVTDLGKYDEFQKHHGPSGTEMGVHDSDRVNSGYPHSDYIHSGEDDRAKLVDKISEHKNHIRIDNPVTKQGTSEAGGPSQREKIVIESEHDASMSHETGEILSTSSAAVVDNGEDRYRREAASGSGIAGEMLGSTGTAGVQQQSQLFDPTHGGTKEWRSNFDSSLAQKQNATDIISYGLGAETVRPANYDLYDEPRNQEGTNRPEFSPEQRPIGEGETPLWLSGDEDYSVNEDKHHRGANTRGIKHIGGSGDHSKEQFLNLSSDLIRPFLKKSADSDNDLFIISRNAIKKSDVGRTLVIAGWGNYHVVDREGHIIGLDALRRGLNRFLMDSKFANVNIFHSSIQVAELLPEFTDDNGQTWYSHVNDEGFFAVVAFRTDIAVARKAMVEVLKGNLRGFSLSGNSDVDNRTEECKDGHCWSVINDVEFYELTLCEIPMNQQSWVTDIVQFPDASACPECVEFLTANRGFDSSLRPL